jgi:hypothetical protein
MNRISMVFGGASLISVVGSISKIQERLALEREINETPINFSLPNLFPRARYPAHPTSELSLSLSRVFSC